MIIGIDASRAVKKERTGTENYSRNLIFELAKIDAKNQYILYVGPDYDGTFDNFPKNFSIKIIPNKKYWTQIGLSFEMFKNKPDVLFIPSHILPPIPAKKAIITIHDLAWKYFPDMYSPAELRLQDLSIRRAIKQEAEIIVYSSSTVRDLQKFYKINKNKLHFVPMGFGNLFNNKNRDSQTSRHVQGDTLNQTNSHLSVKTKQPYLLFVGRIELRKNMTNLIEAYTMLRSERKINHKLLLVGKPGFGYEKIKLAIEKSKYKDDIIETGFVSDKDLSQLYKNASIFVFPSFYEGFGFPIFEAYSAKIPVITSNTSSMPEVAGKGAILVNPKKPFEIAAAMSQILNKPQLREKLIREGQSQLKHYSWQQCAEYTLKILEVK